MKRDETIEVLKDYRDQYKRWIYGEDSMPSIENHAARIDALTETEGENRACPCNYGEPCQERCTCVNPFSSSGCLNCCTYGSQEQRESMAKHLKSQQRPSEEVGKDEIEELWEKYSELQRISLDDIIGFQCMDKFQFKAASKAIIKLLR